MVKEERANTPTREDIVQRAADQSRTKNVAWLMTLAKQANEQKRTQNCLSLTRAILLVDPENQEALALQSALEGQPEETHADAGVQFPSTEAAVQFLGGYGADGSTEPSPGAARRPLPEGEDAASYNYARPEEQWTALGTPEPVKNGETNHLRLRSVALAIVAVVLAFVITSWLTHRGKSSDTAPVAPPPTSSAQQPATGQPVAKQTVEQASVNPPAPEPLPTAKTPLPLVTTPPAPLPPTAAPPKATVPFAMGTLVVTSTYPAEIYERGRLLGSTPTSLRLAPGAHEIEYRYNGLQKSFSYIVKTNETTTAEVTFDVTVQINARPWARVFIGEDRRQALGQTPLGNVRLEAGSVLVFENPNFGEKTYRVSGKESAIQINFP